MGSRDIGMKSREPEETFESVELEIESVELVVASRNKHSRVWNWKSRAWNWQSRAGISNRECGIGNRERGVGSGSHVYELVDIESCCRESWQDPFSCLHWVVMLSTTEEISSASPKKSETKLSTMVMMCLGDAHLVSEPLLVRWRMDNRY